MDLPCSDEGAGVADYAAAVVEAVTGIEGTVVLVGHFLGGLTVPVVATMRPVSRRSAPEDAGWVAIDLGQQVVDMWGWQPVVDVEPEVAVAPVQRPGLRCLRVPQAGDGEAGPVRPRVVLPGRAAFDDGEVPGRELAFNADLVSGASGDARSAPALNPRDVQVRKPSACRRRPCRRRCRHAERSAGAARRGDRMPHRAVGCVAQLVVGSVQTLLPPPVRLWPRLARPR